MFDLIFTHITWKRWGSDHSKLDGRIIYVKCHSTFFYHLKNHIPDPKISDPHVSWIFLGPVRNRTHRWIDRKWTPWPFSIANDFDFRPFFCRAFFCTVSWGQNGSENCYLLGWGNPGNPIHQNTRLWVIVYQLFKPPILDLGDDGDLLLLKDSSLRLSIFSGGCFKYFVCSSLVGDMIQFDEHIFSTGVETTNYSF